MELLEKLFNLMEECREQPSHIGLPLQRALGRVITENFNTGDNRRRVSAIIQGIPLHPEVNATEKKTPVPISFTEADFGKKPLPQVNRRVADNKGVTESTVDLGQELTKRLFAEQKAKKAKEDAKQEAFKQEDAALAPVIPDEAATTAEDEAAAKTKVAAIQRISEADYNKMKSLYSSKQRALDASMYLFGKVPMHDDDMRYKPLLEWMIKEAQYVIAQA